MLNPKGIAESIEMQKKWKKQIKKQQIQSSNYLDQVLKLVKNKQLSEL